MSQAPSALGAPFRDLSRPAFAIKVDGTPLDSALALQVSRIRVDDDADLPGVFDVELLAGGPPDDETAWIDGAPFAIGAAVEISLGYGDALQGVIAGEVTALEPEFTRGGHPRLTVRGHDRRHRLLRGRKTRSFVQQKDSDVASALAAEAGLTAQVEDSQVVHDYILQSNQTNLEFLLLRARRIEYELVVDGQALHFRPVQNAEGESLTLTPGDDLISFVPRLATLAQITEVTLRGWSVKDKKEIVATAQAGDEVSTMGGGDTGAAIAQGAFGDAVGLVTDQPVYTQAEADQAARARFNRGLLGLVRGEGICSGRTDLRPGLVIRIDGVGKRFSGAYYVSGVSHRYSAHSPYETHFAVRRNAT